VNVSTIDLWVAIAVVVVMPLIIAVNINRQDGIMGYLWREAPNLARIGLAFLVVTWFSAIRSVLYAYGLLSAETDTTISVVLGIPMFALSMIILIWGTILFVRFFKSRANT
jgi:hypothetical protein